jgi:drug/metabolite transporter (DMT)-like permease
VVTLTLAFAFHSNEIVGLAGIAFLWFLLAGVVNFPLGRLLNFTGVSLVGVSKASPIVGSSPLFATILAVTIGGESISLPILAGTLSIVGGLGLILSQK